METKTVRNAKEIEIYKHFGWKKSQTKRERHGRLFHDVYILSRDETMKNYDKLVGLEKRYLSNMSQLQTYKNDNVFFIALVLLLLFIIPGVIYLIYKNKQKNEININNTKIQKKLKEIIKEADALL